MKDVHKFSCFGVRFEDSPNGGFMVHHDYKSSSVVEVKSEQHLDPSLVMLKESIFGKLNEPFSLGDGVLRY